MKKLEKSSDDSVAFVVFLGISNSWREMAGFFFPEGMDMYKLEMILLILISAKTHLQQMIWFHWNFLNLIYITVSTAFSTGGEDVKST